MSSVQSESSGELRMLMLSVFYIQTMATKKGGGGGEQWLTGKVTGMVVMEPTENSWDHQNCFSSDNKIASFGQALCLSKTGNTKKACSRTMYKPLCLEQNFVVGSIVD